ENVLVHVDEFTELKAKEAAAAKSCKGPGLVAQAALETATQQSRKLNEALKIYKSEISAYTYQSEHKAHESGHAKAEESPEARPVIDELDKVRATEVEY